MLHLKRASAGSGKTYELAKTFIKQLLSIKDDGKKRRLRDKETIRDALGSIMAVTFTVKATGEMKQRIIENLAKLADADNIEDGKEDSVPYLKDFISEFHSTKYEIADRARHALRELLLHYSEFRVQTIDSFFQSILHTFAYEVSLDDNFNMEIDTDYVTSVGFDAALDALSSAFTNQETDSETLFWLREIMNTKRGSNQWNVFERKEGPYSLYGELIRNAQNLEKEDFQLKRHSIENYFLGLNRPFSEVVTEVERMNLEPWQKLYRARKEAASELMEELKRARLSAGDIYDRKGSALLRDLNEEFEAECLKDMKSLKLKNDKKTDWFLSGNGEKLFKQNIKKYDDLNESLIYNIDSAFLAWVKAHNDFADAYQVPAKRKQIDTWLAYRFMMPFYMIVLEIARKKREFLEATNTLVISDTNHILSRIIGKDDAPFVYERMGSRLNHFLIDEFQDTSQMQWHNIYPLLAESEGRGEDNLIIGDAKQSIYRFRNADYRLITKVVPKYFPDIVPYTSDTDPEDPAKENTNYRSKARVVKFNNHIFDNITGIKQPDGTDLFHEDIKAIYEGAMQNIPEKVLEENKGFVDIIIYPRPTSDEKREFETVGYESLAEPGFLYLPERIIELKSRGYDFKDIGVLVKSHDQGSAVVKTISAWNEKNPKSPIRFISEENLLVSSSLSVKIIIRALEMAAKGPTVKVKENPVLQEPIDEKRLYGLLASLQSPSLVSIVESVVGEFLSDRCEEDAPFIAAFQDAVLDYSMNHTSDIGTFLKWWKRKSKSLTINSPEDSDGVKIHTIHGAKGLEYKCVIIPKVNIVFSPGQHSEWKWVKPSECVEGYELLPPFVPVLTSKSLETTAHKKDWEQYCKDVALDELNKLYVGFTRAVNELYAYIPLQKNSTSASQVLMSLMEDGEIVSADGRCEKIEINRPAPNLPPDSVEYCFGRPLSKAEVLAEKKNLTENPELLSCYKVYSDRELLTFKEGSKMLDSGVTESDPEEMDPRSEGTLKHRIMQLIETSADLDRALLEIKVGGLASPLQLNNWKIELTNALESVKEYGWFSPGVKVLNERSLIYSGHEYLRPDRLILGPENNVTIVDYKFGAKRNEHKKQVKDYAERLARTGRFSTISGYLWYVSLGEVEKVV